MKSVALELLRWLAGRFKAASRLWTLGTVFLAGFTLTAGVLTRNLDRHLLTSLLSFAILAVLHYGVYLLLLLLIRELDKLQANNAFTLESNRH